MKIALYLLLFVVFMGVGAAGMAYLLGRRLPVDHVASVTGTVEAPPEKVFAIITDVQNGASWRKQVKSVEMLPPDEGRDHWVENLGHGQTMTFLALRTEPVAGTGAGSEVARREVLLDVPGAAYGGKWLYELSPVRTSDGQQATELRITETGFIKPLIYRFVMKHVMGMTSNLDQYLHDIQAKATKS